MSRRRDFATTTVGAGTVAAGGYLSHSAIQDMIRRDGQPPRVHGIGVMRRGSKLMRRKYAAGTGLKVVGGVPLAIGATRFVRGDKDDVTKRDRQHPSFLKEGLQGSVSALGEKKQNITQRDVPTKARLAGLGTNIAAGIGGSYAARLAMRGKSGGMKSLVTPVAGVLTGAASVPLSSKVVDRVSPGYEVTAAGVKRKKKPFKRPSSASYRHMETPRSFQADIVKFDERKAKYRAGIMAAGTVPIAGYGLQASAARRDIKSTSDKNKASATQFGAAAGGDAVGFLAGSHGAAKLAQHNARFRHGAENLSASIHEGKNKARARVGLPEKAPKAPNLKPAGAGGGRAGAAYRAAVKPLRNPKTAVAAGLGGVAGMMVAGNTASQLNINRNYRKYVNKRAAPTPGMTRAEEQKQLKRKARSATLSTISGATGLAGVGLLAATKHPAMAPHVPQLERYALGTAIAGGGIGGYNSLKGARIARKDIRARRKALGTPVIKGMPGQTDMHVPTGLIRAKSYKASSIRTSPTGKLVRVAAGVR